MRLTTLPLLLSAAIVAFPAVAATVPDTDAGLRAAIDGPQRSAAHKARDRYRHPRETLEFFGIRPDMTVIELWPEGGWYTEILAPFLHDNGQLIEAGFPTDSHSSSHARMAAALTRQLASNPKIYGNVKRVYFEPPRRAVLGPPDSADLVLTFRNLHNWQRAGVLKQVFTAAYRVLKPGGVFGVVEHRAKPGAKVTESARSGYMPVPYVIDVAGEVGFKLAAQSEINANPKDTKDYPDGVWTLPPTYRLGDKDKAKYAAIGESDRMTLRFVKPGKSR
jgi:predicted methyltransferase